MTRMETGNNVIIRCTNSRGLTWTHLGKINHINVNLFKIRGDRDWYDQENIVKQVEPLETGTCLNCGKPCRDTMCKGSVCFNETEWKVKNILWADEEHVWVQWDVDDSITCEPRKNIEEDIPDMFKEFLWQERCNPGNGFTFSYRHHDTYRDLRLREDRHFLRENLWSREDEPEVNKHTTYDQKLRAVDGRWLPKSRFADRRLKWANRGKRYNLHPH